MSKLMGTACAAALLGLLVSFSPAEATEHLRRECSQGSMSSTRCEVVRREVRAGVDGGGTRTVRRVQDDRAVRNARVLRMADGTCTTIGEALDFVDDESPDRQLVTRDCPEARAPAITPELLVEQLVVDIDLPVPGAHIAPGWMIVGRTAYLETGATMAYAHPPVDTPLGPLGFSAASEIWVDWGDGTVTGPHLDPGGPYPDGTITHAYSRSGHYDVVVTQRWTADWAVGGAAGRLDGLETSTTLPDFEVRQLQAVRRR